MKNYIDSMNFLSFSAYYKTVTLSVEINSAYSKTATLSVEIYSMYSKAATLLNKVSSTRKYYIYAALSGRRIINESISIGLSARLMASLSGSII